MVWFLFFPHKYSTSVPSYKQACRLWSGEDLLCALCSVPVQLQSGLHDKLVTAPFIFVLGSLWKHFMESNNNEEDSLSSVFKHHEKNVFCLALDHKHVESNFLIESTHSVFILECLCMSLLQYLSFWIFSFTFFLFLPSSDKLMAPVHVSICADSL